MGCFCEKEGVNIGWAGSISAISPTHMGFDLAASDSRPKIMVTLTDTNLFLSHIMSRAGVAVP